MRVAPHLTALVLGATPLLVGQTAPLWRHTATAPINFFRVTPLGTVVVATADGLVALDAESGLVRWKRDDLKNVASPSYSAISESPFATVRVGGQVELLDLVTGATKWRMAPRGDLQPYVPIPERGLILAYGSNDSLKPVLAAVDLETGAVHWQHVHPFNEAPEEIGQDYVGHQPALWVSDSTFILYVSKDGPVLVHAGTGEWLWRADSLQGKKPPAPGVPVSNHERRFWRPRGHATMLLADSVVYVPFEKRLQAIRTRDGMPLWREAPAFPTPIAQLQVTAQGIVLRGQLGPTRKAWLDLIDPATGTSRWNKQVKGLEYVTPFVVGDDRVYVAANERLLAVSLDDGTVTQLTRFDFEGGDQPFHLERRGSALLLIGYQNLSLVDSAGTERYHTYHPAPGRSTLGKVALGALTVIEAVADLAQTDLSSTTLGCGCMTYPDLGKRYPASERARDFVYSMAHEEDSTGRKRPVFLRLHKDDGRVTGRVWLEEKRPDYLLDRIAGKLYVREGDTGIVAFQM